jgi:hypothetical protein
MLDFARYVPMLLVFALVAALHLWKSRRRRRAVGARRGRAAALAAALGIGLILAGAALGFTPVVRRVPAGPWVAWTRAAAIAWSLVSAGLFAAAWLWRRSPAFDPGRRRALRSAAGAALGAPLAACGLGVYVATTRIGAREVEARRIPPSLTLRCALTDIISARSSPAALERPCMPTIGVRSGGITGLLTIPTPGRMPARAGIAAPSAHIRLLQPRAYARTKRIALRAPLASSASGRSPSAVWAAC